MNTRGMRARRKPGVLTLAVLVIAGIACNAGATGSNTGQADGGQVAPANVQGEVASGDGEPAEQPQANEPPALAQTGAGAAQSSQAQTSGGSAESGGAADTEGGTNSGGGHGIIRLEDAQTGPGVTVELDFGGGGAGGCPDPCGFCGEEGTTYDPITEPTLLYTYQYVIDYVILPDAYTTVCACGYPDQDIDATYLDPYDAEYQFGLDVVYREEAQSYCAIADVDFNPGTPPGDYYLTLEHPAGDVVAWIDVRAPDHPTARWYGGTAWFAGFDSYEPVDVYFWASGAVVLSEATATYLGRVSGTATDLGEVYVDTIVDGIDANVIGITAASGEVVGCWDGIGVECMTISGQPLEDVIFLRTDP